MWHNQVLRVPYISSWGSFSFIYEINTGQPHAPISDRVLSPHLQSTKCFTPVLCSPPAPYAPGALINILSKNHLSRSASRYKSVLCPSPIPALWSLTTEYPRASPSWRYRVSHTPLPGSQALQPILYMGSCSPEGLSDLPKITQGVRMWVNPPIMSALEQCVETALHISLHGYIHWTQWSNGWSWEGRI